MSGQKSDLKIESLLNWRTGWIWSPVTKKSKATLRRKVILLFQESKMSWQKLCYMTESVYFHTAGPVRGILKPVSIPSKPPVPSRSRVNAVLGVGLVNQNPIGNFITIFEWAGEKQRQRQQLARLLRFIFCLTPPGGVQYCVCFSLHCSRATIQSRG